MANLKHSLALAATLLTAGIASAQTFTTVPGAFSCDDITPDGAIVCGTGSGGGYYWDWKNAPAPTFIGGNSAVSISDDGMWIAGSINDPGTGAEVAGRYSVASGQWESLGWLPNAQQCPSLSSAYAISGDGTQVVGLSWDQCDGRGFLWEQGIGMQELENLQNGHNRASVIANDGSLIAGFAQGNCRTATTWNPNTTQGVVFDSNSCSEVLGISDTGSRLVGTWDGQAFYKDGAGPVTPFGSMVPGDIGNAMDCNEAGTRIVGFDSFLLNRTAWVWGPTTGFTNLYAALDNAGVPGLPFNGLSGVVSCSADGETMTGFTTFGGCWIVELPICAGGVANRCQTAPNSVSGIGALMSTSGGVSISSNNLVLSASPVPNQPGLFYYSTALLGGGTGFPFGNGWRCVGPSPIFRLPITTASGNTLSTAVDFNSAPTSNINPGSTWFFQAWYRDPAAGGESFNLSDALEISFCD